jgi:uncharacterized membrane protein
MRIATKGGWTPLHKDIIHSLHISTYKKTSYIASPHTAISVVQDAPFTMFHLPAIFNFSGLLLLALQLIMLPTARDAQQH